MAPFTAWLPARPNQASDLVVKIVGDGVAGLKTGIAALEQALVREGFQVMAQRGRLNGEASLSTVRLRVSTEPVGSMGNGCDVLAYLDEGVPPLSVFGLGPGSVVLCEAAGIRDWHSGAIPPGVITYPIPFVGLSRRVGKSFSGKGLIAIGALTQLFGIPADAVRCYLKSWYCVRYFDAGVTYAIEHLRKRDVYALPLPPASRRQVLLDAHRAMLFGIGVARCGCGPACSPALDRPLDHWVAEHVSAARDLVSSLKNRRLPGVTVYRGPSGRFMALLGSENPTLVRADTASDANLVLLAADLPDVIRFTSIAHQLLRDVDANVWVLVDDILVNREQSVDLTILEEAVREAQHPQSRDAQLAFSSWPFTAERDGELGADVGYVTWGAAQGVVRDAVALCRSFGLNVAALYPKVLRPVPVEDLVSFAASVKHLVVVEPNQFGRYTDLVRSKTGLEPSTIMPEPGNGLTPMDIFLCEGLGAHNWPT